MPDPVSPDDFGALAAKPAARVAPEDFGKLVAPEDFGKLATKPAAAAIPNDWRGDTPSGREIPQTYGHIVDENAGDPVTAGLLRVGAKTDKAIADLGEAQKGLSAVGTGIPESIGAVGKYAAQGVKTIFSPISGVLDEFPGNAEGTSPNDAVKGAINLIPEAAQEVTHLPLVKQGLEAVGGKEFPESVGTILPFAAGEAVSKFGDAAEAAEGAIAARRMGRTDAAALAERTKTAPEVRGPTAPEPIAIDTAPAPVEGPNVAAKMAELARPTGLDARLAKAGHTLASAVDAAVRNRPGELDMLRPADRAFIDSLVKERARAASFPKQPELMEAFKAKLAPPEAKVGGFAPVAPEDFGKLIEPAAEVAAEPINEPSTTPASEPAAADAEVPAPSPEVTPAAGPSADSGGAAPPPEAPAAAPSGGADDTAPTVSKILAGRSHLDRLIDVVNRAVKTGFGTGYGTDAAIEKLGGTKMGQGAKKVGAKLTTPERTAQEQTVGEPFHRGMEQRRGDVAVDYDTINRHEQAIQKATKGKSPDAVAQTTAWFRGKSDLPAGYSPEQVTQLTEARRYLNETIRPKEIPAGTKSPEAQAEYPFFLKRQYEAFEGDQPPARQMGAGRPPKPYEAAHDAYTVRLKGIPQSDAAALVDEAARPDYLKYAKASDDTLVKFDTPEARDAYVKRFVEKFGKDSEQLVTTADKMTAEEEAALRPIHDTATLYGRTGREAAARAAKGEFHNALLDMTDERGKYVLDPHSAEAMRASRPENVAVGAESGYSKVEGRGWDKLDGKLVRNDVKAVLEDTFGKNQQLALDGNAALRFAKGFMDSGKGSNAAFRVQKVVLNTALFARHVGAMLMQLRAGGIEGLNAVENGPRMARWLEDTAPGGRFHEDYVRSRLGDHDVGGHTEGLHGEPRTGPWTPERVGEMIFSGGLSEGLGSKKIAQGYRAGIRVMGKGLSSPYNAAKRMILASKLESGMSFEQAVAETRRATLSRHDVGALTTNLSNVPFVGPPFLRYKVGIARIYLNMLADNPVRFAMDRMQNSAIQAALLAYAGVKLTQKEKDAIENEHPGAIAYGRDEKTGELQLIDGRYLDPAGDFTARRVKVGDSAAWQRIKDASGVSDSPSGDLWHALSTGTDRFDRPLNKSGTFAGGIKGGLKEYAREVMPGLTPGVGYTSDKIAAAAKGEQVSPGVQRQNLIDALLEAVGAKRTTLDPRFERTRLGREAARQFGENKTDVRFNAKRGAEPDRAGLREGNADVADELKKRLVPWARGATR